MPSSHLCPCSPAGPRGRPPGPRSGPRGPRRYQSTATGTIISRSMVSGTPPRAGQRAAGRIARLGAGADVLEPGEAVQERAADQVQLARAAKIGKARRGHAEDVDRLAAGGDLHRRLVVRPLRCFPCCAADTHSRAAGRASSGPRRRRRCPSRNRSNRPRPPRGRACRRRRSPRNATGWRGPAGVHVAGTESLKGWSRPVLRKSGYSQPGLSTRDLPADIRRRNVAIPLLIRTPGLEHRQLGIAARVLEEVGPVVGLVGAHDHQVQLAVAVEVHRNGPGPNPTPRSTTRPGLL